MTKSRPRDLGELYAEAYEAGRQATIRERGLVSVCCAREALRANIANGEGLYVGGYHGTEYTAIQAAVSLDAAVKRHPDHICQPDTWGTEAREEPPVGTVYADPEDGGIHVWTRHASGWHCSRRDCDHCPCGWDEVIGWLGGIERLTRYLPGEKADDIPLDLPAPTSNPGGPVFGKTGPDPNEPSRIVKAYRADRGGDAESILDPTGKTMHTVCEVCGRRVITDPCLEHQPNAYDAVTRLRELSPDGRVPSSTYSWLMFGIEP